MAASWESTPHDLLPHKLWGSLTAAASSCSDTGYLLVASGHMHLRPANGPPMVVMPSVRHCITSAEVWSVRLLHHLAPVSAANIPLMGSIHSILLARSCLTAGICVHGATLGHLKHCCGAGCWYCCHLSLNKEMR